MYQERSKIGIPALAEAQQIGLAAGRVLPGHETQPCGKLAAIVEVLRVSDGGDQRAGADWSDAGYLTCATESQARTSAVAVIESPWAMLSDPPSQIGCHVPG